MRCIKDNRTRITEGYIRSKELSDYLDNLQAVKTVWLSEDATAIVAKVVYDSVTNQMVGIVLPMDEATGCPKPFTFLATDAEIIKQHLTNDRSSVVYLLMAQPLDEKIPPFVLQMFGSNQKFTTKDVVHRWDLITNELKKYIFFHPSASFHLI